MPERPNKKESGIDRIFRLPSDEEQLALEDFHELLNRREPFPLERHKTSTEAAIVRHVTEHLGTFVESYGGSALPLDERHVRFIDPSLLPDEAREHLAKRDEHGRYYPDAQLVLIFPGSSRLTNAHSVVHELLHLHSFGSYTQRGSERTRRQLGLTLFSIRRGPSAFFESLDEAVVEELVRRFDESHFAAIPELAEEMEHREALRRAAGEDLGQDIAAPEKDSQGTVEPSRVWAYPIARRKLLKIIEDIHVASPDHGREAIFREFAQALFSGRVLAIARLIEHTYGQGAFRSLGETTGRRLGQREAGTSGT